MAGESRRAPLRRRLVTVVATALLIGAILAVAAIAQAPDQTDPARNIALPCEAVGSPTAQLLRAAKNFVHMANVCEFVATDVEFQSRTMTGGTVHDYAFAGSMGGGFRIFDVTNPTRPLQAGTPTPAGRTTSRSEGTSRSPPSTASTARIRPGRRA